MTKQLDRWTIAFYTLMAIGVAAGIFHIVSGRYGNGLIALSAVIVGILVQRQTAARPRPRVVEPRERQQGPTKTGPRWDGAQFNRTSRLGDSILAGFPATVVMTIVFIFGFLISGAFGTPEGNQLNRWFWALTNNELTDTAYDIPVGAYSLNLFAGLLWAVVYGYLFEPRVQGPGWRKGMLFSLIPWLVSLVVFFPLVGAGFFGLDLGAGPLPAIGNLILHLVYGAVLGAIYAIPDIVPAEPDLVRLDDWEAEAQNRGLVLGLIGGLGIGVIVGSVIGVFFTPVGVTEIEMVLAGASVGVMTGAIAGPLLGLSARPPEREEAAQQS